DSPAARVRPAETKVTPQAMSAPQRKGYRGGPRNRAGRCDVNDLNSYLTSEQKLLKVTLIKRPRGAPTPQPIAVPIRTDKSHGMDLLALRPRVSASLLAGAIPRISGRDAGRADVAGGAGRHAGQSRPLWCEREPPFEQPRDQCRRPDRRVSECGAEH